MAADLVNRLWGAGDLSVVFGHGAPKAVCPFPRAGGSKHEPSVRQSFTQELIDSPLWLSEVDPRALWSSQGWVLREHAEYYRTGRWELTGITSADRDRESNRFPVIIRDSLGRLVIAAGHHRATVALIEGRPLLCRLFPSQPDGAIALLPHVLLGTSSRLGHVVCSTLNEATESAHAGHVVLCIDRDLAITTAQSLSPSLNQRPLPIGAGESA